MNDRLGDSESLNVYGILYSLMGDDEVVIWNDQLSLEIMKSVNNNEGIVNKFDECKGDLEQSGRCMHKSNFTVWFWPFNRMPQYST